MKHIVLVFTLTISLISKADEGMWLPQLLNAMNIKDMKKNGLKLSAEQIYSINKSSFKRCDCSIWRWMHSRDYF